MTAETSEKRHWSHVVLVCFALALVGFYLLACIRVVRQSVRDEARPAGAIVVFGAAEYAGRPSPIFRARLDHAFELFRKELAPVIIVSGGSGGDPLFTEGQVGRDYLYARGVSDRHLIAETQADNTAESAARVAVILRANGINECIAVSDGYHVFRIKQMLKRHGITAYGSPRSQDVPMRWEARVGAVLRESLSYALWYLHIT